MPPESQLVDCILLFLEKEAKSTSFGRLYSSFSRKAQVFWWNLGEADPGGLGACPQKLNWSIVSPQKLNWSIVFFFF
jgi:hypothetical protein